MTTQQKFLLGQLLIEKGIITQDQLDLALKKQKETKEKLGIILLELGFVDEETVFLPILAGQIGVDYINLKDIEPPSEALNQLPAKIVSHYKIMPIDYKNNTLTFATSKPLDVHLLDEISVLTSAKLNPVLASDKDILESIRKYYGLGAETIEKMMGNVQPSAQEESAQQIDEIDSEASISKFLNQILLEAYNDRATDIHIEPFEDQLKVRYRVDGVLVDAKVPSNIKHFKDSINSRIKILSNLNIAEKRIPQDGRFKVRANDIDLDLRVSFLPTQYGESVVLRILNATSLFGFEQLGLNEHERKVLNGLLDRPHGIIFITGPTGSGKTTTLYTCLTNLNTEDNKIITIEDPVEYQLRGITQIQINPRIGLTFAQGLRSMLRHDPDIMMVGEVRDIETAEIAIQCALTGHLIFSTLHTNDAATGVTRLIDMGVDPYLINSTVDAFIAQRLVRTVCSKCRQSVRVPNEILQKFNQPTKDPVMVFEGQGCQACKMTGFTGRVAIYEFLVLNEDIQNLIMKRATAGEIREQAVKGGMKTLMDSGWEKIKEGMTTPQEVLRVIN